MFSDNKNTIDYLGMYASWESAFYVSLLLIYLLLFVCGVFYLYNKPNVFCAIKYKHYCQVKSFKRMKEIC